MRILVLGSTGMLGHMVLKVLAQEKEWEVRGVDSQDFNVVRWLEDSPLAPQRTVLDELYDYVINCIGALAGGDEAQMQKVNTEFPKRLALATRAKIIHISTDGIFSGKGGPYDEDSVPDATDAYGKSKLQGEVNAPNVLNIRTSIIGPSPNKKKGLLEWFLAQPDGAVVKGFTNHIWNGVTTLQFAQLCEKIIKTGMFDALRKESPVFHFAPNEPVTKYELLGLFQTVYNKNVHVEPVEDPRGKVERVLKTKYETITKLVPCGMNMEKALVQLSQYAQ